MHTPDLDEAIHRLCQAFQWHTPVDILIVGGAAGMLTGVFSLERTTGDVDVMVYCPNNAMAALESLAETIGQDMGLPGGWFNSKVQIRSDSLPDGWAERKQLVSRGDCLAVHAASRSDLLAMKILAHRAQDLEDVEEIGLSADDKVFVRRFLDQLPGRGTSAIEVSEAIEVLESYSVTPSSVGML